MVDLLGKKIWIGNDRQLLKQVEEYAFIINMMSQNRLPISKYHTHKNRFDSIREWNSNYHHQKTEFEELDAKLLIPKNIELW